MLRYMWVLTFAEAEFDHRRAMREVQLFVRRLKHAGLLPAGASYLSAPEPHPKGHGWHVNLLVSLRIDIDAVEPLWGSGHVWVKDWGKEREIGSLRERVRAAAAYAGKYAGKDVGEIARYGCSIEQQGHRYEVARGHSPRWTKTSVGSEARSHAGDLLAWHASSRHQLRRSGGRRVGALLPRDRRRSMRDHGPPDP